MTAEGLLAPEGPLQNLFDHINSLDTNEQQIQAYLSILSQLKATACQFQGHYESALKSRLYVVCTINREAALAVITDARFKEDPFLSEVIEKIEYLSKNAIKAYLHHLQKNLGHLHTMSKGAAYFMAGSGMIIASQSIEKLVAQNKDTAWEETLRTAALLIGSGMIISPFISAFLGARKDKP